MARSAYKLPRVFVACPYSEKRFKFTLFKKELSELPWTCIYADTTIETKQLLLKIKRLINTSDMCLFDLSMWNPNVALELGLAEGMSSIKYYILVNEKLDKDVPSDIKGIQRIPYIRSAKSKKRLDDELIEKLFKQKFTITKEIWRKMSHRSDSKKTYKVALKILSHLRDYESFDLEDCKKIGKGTSLRQHSYDEIINILIKVNVIKKQYGQSAYVLKREIFKEI